MMITMRLVVAIIAGPVSILTQAHNVAIIFKAIELIKKQLA